MGKLQNDRTRSQAKTILKYLKTHKRGISQKQAAELFGINCLAERVRDLRGKGHVIDNEWHSYKDENGHVVRYTSYILVREAA